MPWRGGERVESLRPRDIFQPAKQSNATTMAARFEDCVIAPRRSLSTPSPPLHGKQIEHWGQAPLLLALQREAGEAEEDEKPQGEAYPDFLKTAARH